MKKSKLASILLFITLGLGVVFFQACKKEDEQAANQNPVCTITSPTDGMEYTAGQSVSIVINATDSDGNIREVRIVINDIQKAILSSSPYKYEWNTSGENPGNYIIKAISTDNQGATDEDVIEVKLKEEDTPFDTYTDPRDGKTYVTVKIGDQTWFTENLLFDEDTASIKIANRTNISSGYFSWKSAQSACPDGWHLPTDEEWKTFETDIHMTQSDADAIGWRGTVQGMWLKSKEGWKYEGNGTDRYGFNAIPEGYLNDEGDLFKYEEDAIFWTATFHDSEESAWYRRLNYSADGIYRSSTSSSARFNVRCLKD